MNVLEILSERGFVEATTHDQELKAFLSEGTVSCYIGFDPTADSLHVGSLIPIMSLAHVQRAGHRPIALVGGGTGLVGDPSGKTEMRKVLTVETVQKNAGCIGAQLARFIDFSDGKAVLENNAKWLTGLKYIDFLRDIGRHFSVNRMIKAESCRMRMESEEGLSFIEFNYMLLQAYDFLELYDRYGCRLQMGGSDQWGNIVAGVDLIRRMRQEQAFGITFPLITTAEGAKMGKTAAGAVWLDAARTSPYDYYQFWINTHDKDVARFLALFTFLPMEEIKEVEKLSGADLNASKAVLSFEATALAHGEDQATAAFEAACANFGKRRIPETLLPSSLLHQKAKALEGGADATPTSQMDPKKLEQGMPAFELFFEAGLCDSKGAARRLITQGGAYINGAQVAAFDMPVSMADVRDGEIVLRAGKKRHHRILIKK